MSDTDRIDLAHVPGFALGSLIVRPGTRELVRDDGAIEVLEPRVMQVLVALARAEGSIVTRDELSRWCWEGRVVGEDAINRVISRLRRAAEGIGEGAFKVETITKVGYRLVRAGEAAARVPVMTRMPRRSLIIGGAAAGTAILAGTGFVLWPRGRAAASPPPQVTSLMQAGLSASRQTTGDGDLQARGLFRRVTELAPDYADGWGALAMIYAIESHYHAPAEVEGLVERARAAIARAKALDSTSVYVMAATISLLPSNRWLESEHALRAGLRDHPDSDTLLQPLGRTLARVGRMGEAAQVTEQAVAATEASPLAMFDLMNWQWAAGRLDEADRTIDRAMQLFPRNFAVWFGTFYIRLFTGRIADALALAENHDGRPATIPDSEIENVIHVARAMQSRDPAAIDAVMAELRGRARQAAGYAENAMQFAAALGRIDDAFAIAHAYYLDRGFSVPAIRFPRGQGSYTRIEDRRTWFLFFPIAAAMRADARFDRLVADLGLKRYWHEASVKPDYLK